MEGCYDCGVPKPPLKERVAVDKLRSMVGKSRLTCWRLETRYLWEKWRDRAYMSIAWRLPRAWVYWCAIRLAAHGTAGRYGGTVVPELTALEALKRWQEGRDVPGSV